MTDTDLAHPDDLADGWDSDDAWRCRDDNTAARLLARLAAETAEVDRIHTIAQARRDEFTEWEAAATRPRLAAIERIEGHLIAYRRLLEENDPGLRKTLPLPGGALTRRSSAQRVEIDDEDAVAAWCAEHAPDVVTVETRRKIDKRALLAVGMLPELSGDEDPHVEHRVALSDPFGNRPPVPGVQIVKPADRYAVTLDRDGSDG